MAVVIHPPQQNRRAPVSQDSVTYSSRFVFLSGLFVACLVISNVIAVKLVDFLAVALPAPGFFQDEPAWAAVLGMAPRVAVASLIAYWAGEFSTSAVLSLLKKATKGKMLWTRTIGSTLVGQAADTGLFITIAFAGMVPGDVFVGMR